MVMSLDSEWGTGKTTFINMWKDMLDNDDRYKEKFQAFYFNAWENDYLKEPLLALFSEINRQIIENKSIDSKLIDELKNKAKPVLKASLVCGVKMLTRGALDIENINFDDNIKKELTDLAGKIGEIALNEVLADKNARKEFKKVVSEYQKDIDKKIIFFIDELDRCRPTFAIELLEIMKHLFNIDNVVFIVSLDKEQLSYAVSTVYGEKMDTVGYLRRFFDLDYKLPSIPRDKYIDNKYSNVYEEKYNIKLFRVFIKEIMLEENLSLRDIDKAFYYIKLLIPLINEFNTDKNYEEVYKAVISYLYAELIVTKVKKPILYKNIIKGNYITNEVIKSFKDINLDKYNGIRKSEIDWHYEVLKNLISPLLRLFLELNLRISGGESIQNIPSNGFWVGIGESDYKFPLNMISKDNFVHIIDLILFWCK